MPIEIRRASRVPMQSFLYFLSKLYQGINGILAFYKGNLYMNAPESIYCGVLDYRLFWMKLPKNFFGMLEIQNAITQFKIIMVMARGLS